MSNIRILEKHVADKIAAGEVIDRPVSIIKELVENSLDAGASSVTVEIKGGGKDYIRVTDDGGGLAPDDVEVAFRRHATSKISREEDLDAIGTLGFRGEALASICAVSRVEMITKQDGETSGRLVICEGSAIIENKPTGCPKGTTITVKDLFYNTPARLKFLSSDSSESRRIVDMMSRIAMSYPDVRFKVINNGKEAFSTSGRGNILENILRIYGRDLEKDLIPVDHREKDFILRGFVSSPALSSSSRNRQFFSVNGRVVSSKTMERGLEKAYKQRLFQGRFPIAFLFLSIPAHMLDVNVHPTKKEIRFDDPYEIEDIMEKAVGTALMSESSVPRTGSGKPMSESDSPLKAPDRPVMEPKGSSGLPESGSGKPVPAVLGSVTESDSPLPYDSEHVDINNILETMRNKVQDDSRTFQEENAGYSSNSNAHGDRLDIGSLDVIGVGLDTYIITTDGESLYLIDQHAAHERVLFEKFLGEYYSGKKHSQTLLLPFQISVSADLQAQEDLWLDHLHKIGYDIQLFGDKVYNIREVPAFLSGEEGESFLRSFFIELEEKPDISQFASLERIIMRSCKSAIKGGDRMHPREIRALLEQLEQCENPYSCPHGRPVFVKMTRYDLEKMFKRA